MAKIAKVQEVDIKTLRLYERNAKIHSEEQVKKIADSIQEFGFLSPCLIDAEHNVIAGHGRIAAAKLLGRETVPCVFIEGLTDEERRAYTLADNKLFDLGEWNEIVLQEEIEDVEFDFSSFDISSGGVKNDKTEIKDPEDVICPRCGHRLEVLA